MNNNDYTPPTLDFHSVKRVRAVAAKEGRDVVAGVFPEFFLQTEVNKEDDPICMKMPGSLDLLLMECDVR